MSLMNPITTANALASAMAVFPRLAFIEGNAGNLAVVARLGDEYVNAAPAASVVLGVGASLASDGKSIKLKLGNTPTSACVFMTTALGVTIAADEV